MSHRYRHLHTLRDGHVDGINAVTFSFCGQYLVSGGNDKLLIVWSIKEGRLLHKIQLQSPVVCLSWGSGKAFFFGCQDGRLEVIENVGMHHLGSRREVLIGVDAPVYALDYDKVADAVAIGVGPEVQIATKYSSGCYATFVLMPEPKNVLSDSNVDNRLRPRSLHFLAKGSQLVVAYLNHGIICWDVETRTNLWQMGYDASDLFRPIGGTALSPDSANLLVYNHHGLCLYQMGNNTPLRTFKYTTPVEAVYPLNPAFFGSGECVTCGSPSGQIHIWDAKTEDVQEVLEHEGHSVQAICVHDNGKLSLLAVTTAQTVEDTYIRIWSGSHSHVGKVGLVSSIGVFAKHHRPLAITTGGAFILIIVCTVLAHLAIIDLWSCWSSMTTHATTITTNALGVVFSTIATGFQVLFVVWKTGLKRAARQILKVIKRCLA